MYLNVCIIIHLIYLEEKRKDVNGGKVRKKVKTNIIKETVVWHSRKEPDIMNKMIGQNC